MNPIFVAAHEVELVCHQGLLKFCFIGGLAVQRWGEPRMTQDVDMTLLTGFGGEEPFVDEMLHHFLGRISDAREFALRNRVLLLKASNGIAIDVSLGAMPFEEHTIDRSSPFRVDTHVTLTTCCAEDLIVHKAFAGRDKDWADIRGIVARQGPVLRLPMIWTELLPLLELKQDTDAEGRLRAIVDG